MKARNPPWNVSAIFLIIGPKEFPKRRLFIETHKKRDRNHGDARDDQGSSVGPPKDDPEAQPTRQKSHVHRIAHVAIEPDDNKALGRSERRWCATARPAEVPDAPECDSKAADGRNCGKPSPACGIESRSAKIQPTGQQPEPQSEEGSAYDQRSGNR